MSNKSPHKQEKEYDLYKLPNGLSIHHLNKHETDFVYNEVFEEKVYLKLDSSLKSRVILWKPECILNRNV